MRMVPDRRRCVCFTGHRDFSCEQSGRILLAVQELIQRGYTDFYAGGARGFDSRAAQAVLHLRKTCPDVRLHLLLPCERVDQTAGWRERDVQLYDYLVRYADEVIVLGEYHHGCMMARNQALVDAASFCLCWYDRTRLRSGTGQTVRMAERAGLRVWNLFVG